MRSSIEVDCERNAVFFFVKRKENSTHFADFIVDINAFHFTFANEHYEANERNFCLG